ncbi:MAG: UDP-glucose/GDP-mannose dehydrogenase family protein [Halieaceae bacterium]|nr:UDP-glucose/GDP-mannose dehydrogenase family protein [Halieaceae bacterium]
MNITVFGTGYVGLVTGACLAEVGNEVVCVDVDESRIAGLNAGEIPIYEPGLASLIERNREMNRLSFSVNAKHAVEHGLFQFVAVGTPQGEDGAADLSQVLQVADTIGRHMESYRIVVNKSTVPVGSADRVRSLIQQLLKEREVLCEFDVVSNPEFLKEGAAINDFMKPDRIVVGTENPRTTELLRQLYAPFNRNRDRLMVMDPRSAELTKYAANAMLATKISFMNEMANLADQVGADIEKVRQGIGSDSRIGYSFIYPGAGFGGSCFPKDLAALANTARASGCPSRILDAVKAVNHLQKQRLYSMINQHFAGDLKSRTIALWGLSFKPNTRDMRDAPSRMLMEALWEEGCQVQAYDPAAMPEARRIYGERSDLLLADTAEAALKDADALVIVTEWRVFQAPDFGRIKAELKQPLIFDGRNLFDPAALKARGFRYYAIGRGETALP